MLVMAGYAAIRKQTEKMQVCAVFQAVIDGIVEFLHLEKIPVLNRLGDPGQLLIYDTARADVQVPHFRIAHLPVRQTHGHAGSADKGHGIFSFQSADVRGSRQLHGVSLTVLAFPKAIHDDESCKFIVHMLFS